MKQFWKKTLWAALLTAAFALSATGCGDDKQPASSTANSASSAAQAADSSTAPEETDSSAETNVFQYEMNDDGTVSITGYQGMEAVLEVPSTVDNYVVSAISNHAFEANQNLTDHRTDSGNRGTDRPCGFCRLFGTDQHFSAGNRFHRHGGSIHRLYQLD